MKGLRPPGSGAAASSSRQGRQVEEESSRHECYQVIPNDPPPRGGGGHLNGWVVVGGRIAVGIAAALGGVMIFRFRKSKRISIKYYPTKV